MKLSRYFQSILTNGIRKDKYWRTYVLLVVIRVLLVFVPQIGYIHPDEFFQSIEVFAGNEFGLEHTRTWEFNNTFPIRSVAISYFILKIPLNLLDFVSIYTKYYLDLELKNSYMYLVYPRLIMCFLSFLNDWSLYKICESYSLQYDIRMLTLGSSFVMLIFGTRTFSNSIEMTLCSVLLYLAADCMINSNTIIYKSEFLQERYQKASSTGEKVRFYKLKSALPSHSYNRILLVATLCVVGVFNRPTFLIFGAPIVFFWLLRGMGTKSVSFLDFNLRIVLFCVCAIPSILFFTLIDSLYFKYLTAGEIHMLDVGIENFVFTPWNFIKYNIDPEKTAQHGVHPRYLHLLVNIPLLFNVLGVVAIVSFAALGYRFLKGDYRYLPRAQSIVGLMSSSIFAPLFILSLINHQEARFLIPLTLPIILLHAPKLVTGFCPVYPFAKENKFLRLIYDKILSGKVSSKSLLKIWYTINISLCLFFGFLHQGGVFHLAQHFSGVMKIKPVTTQVHLVTSHIYNMPLSFVNTPSSTILHTNRGTGQKYRRAKEFFLYEYGSADMDTLVRKIKLILDVCEMKSVNKKQQYRLYLAIPTSLNYEFQDAFFKRNTTAIRHKLLKVFYPHLSMEAPPKIWGRHLCDLHTSYDDLEGTCFAQEMMMMNYGQHLSVSFIFRQFSSFVHQFGLALYRIEINRDI